MFYPDLIAQKFLPLANLRGDGGGFSLLSAQFGLFGPLQGQEFADGLGKSALQGGLIAH